MEAAILPPLMGAAILPDVRALHAGRKSLEYLFTRRTTKWMATRKRHCSYLVAWYSLLELIGVLIQHYIVMVFAIAILWCIACCLVNSGVASFQIIIFCGALPNPMNIII